MMVQTRVHIAKAHQILPGLGWQNAFDWLLDNEVSAMMVVSTDRPEMDKFTIWTPEGDTIDANTYDFLVIMDGLVGVYAPHNFGHIFEILDEDD